MTSDRSLRFRSRAGVLVDAVDVAYVDALELAGTSEHGAEMRLRLRAQPREPGRPWPRHDGDFIELQLRLVGVVGVSLSQVAGMPFQVEGFDIVDVAGRGMEGIAFEVADFERGALHAFAEGLDAGGDWEIV